MQELVDNLLAALKVRIDGLDWMTPETKKRRRRSSRASSAKIGYPDKWKDYSSLEVKRDDPIGNVQRAQVWQWDYQVERLDKPVDRAEWGMLPQEVNAYYNPLNNEIVFPAAILQPPFFDPNADAAVNYGAIGAVIGHEIGHGFDDQGRKFGPDGSLTDWWTEQDDKAFTAAHAQADQAVLRLRSAARTERQRREHARREHRRSRRPQHCVRAYQISLNGKKAPVIEGLSGEQRFFLGWAQVWREKYRDDTLRELVLVGCAQSAQVPRQRLRAQHGRVVSSLRRAARRQAVPQAGRARQDLVGQLFRGPIQDAQEL